VGDVVLRRADGVVAYHLATAVDELTLGISDVVRGADLWPATGAHVAICQVLGFRPPRYGHVPVLCDAQGSRLSKRVASEGLEALRREGFDAPAVIGRLAASIGWVRCGERLSARELLEEVRRRPAQGEGRESLESFRIPPRVEEDAERQSV
jgi:glutamyl-tRNA synthetase